MTVVGVLSLVADVLFIGWSAFVVIILLVATIGKLFGARTIFDDEDPAEDKMQLSKKQVEEIDAFVVRHNELERRFERELHRLCCVSRCQGEPVFYDFQCPGCVDEKRIVQRLDKLQESVDCLAARRLDELASAAADKARDITSNERIEYIKCMLLKLHRSLIDIKESKEVELKSLRHSFFYVVRTSNDCELLCNMVSSLSDALEAVIDAYDSLEEIPLGEVAL